MIVEKVSGWDGEPWMLRGQGHGLRVSAAEPGS
jgi:hypothetical protein